MHKSKRLKLLPDVDDLGLIPTDQFPTLEIRLDRPQDSGKLWRIHQLGTWESDDTSDYDSIAKKHKLIFERGAHAYYVTFKNVSAVSRDLAAAGFCVSHCRDLIPHLY